MSGNVPFSNLSLSIKFCRYCKHDANWSENKTKTDYTIWNIQEGSLVIEINKQKFTAYEGDVLLFYPGDTYKAYANGSECNFLVTFFALETGNHIDLLERKNCGGIYRHSQIAAASRQFYNDYLEGFQNQIEMDFQQYARLLNFIAKLTPYFGQQIPFRAKVSSAEDLRIHKLLEYMNEHYPEPLTNRELASFMGMSEKYFISFFHSHIGKSPKQYLIECRMKYSLVLLADSRNTISDIAMRLNFTDQYSFSKAFKKYYGEAPSSFRKQLG